MIKKTYFIVILILALIALSYYFFAGYFSYYMGQQVPEKTVLASVTPNFAPAPTGISPADYWRNTKTYYNKKYGYSFEYSAREQISYETSDMLAFGYPETGPDDMVIYVEPTLFLSADEWLNEKNSDFQKQYEKEKYPVLTRQFLEKRIKIAGYDAIVTYPGSSMEQFHGEKQTVFIKDKNIYIIFTRYTPEPERLWNSFKFDK